MLWRDTMIWTDIAGFCIAMFVLWLIARPRNSNHHYPQCPPIPPMPPLPTMPIMMPCMCHDLDKCTCFEDYMVEMNKVIEQKKEWRKLYMEGYRENLSD